MLRTLSKSRRDSQLQPLRPPFDVDEGHPRSYALVVPSIEAAAHLRALIRDESRCGDEDAPLF
jgi:hypothetical protein